MYISVTIWLGEGRGGEGVYSVWGGAGGGADMSCSVLYVCDSAGGRGTGFVYVWNAGFFSCHDILKIFCLPINRLE